MVNYIGQQIGNYQLTKLLGHGSFAEVYLGEHIESKEYAAVKLLHSYITDAATKESFLKEAHLITELSNPHIIRLFDIGFNNTTPFLIMSYAPKGPLSLRYPKGSPLLLETIVEYTKQLANALQYAHDKNIIHCDVKPENILLSQEEDLLLGDFGIGHIVQSTRVQTTHNPEGTPMYMAPEQFKGKPRKESDQYALGVLVYQWLSGELPFNGKTFNELMDKHLNDMPPTLSKVSGIPSRVEAVVLKALAKDTKKRFTRIQDFANALEEAIHLPKSRVIIPFKSVFSLRSQISRRTVVVSLLGITVMGGGVALATMARDGLLSKFFSVSPTITSSSSRLETNSRSATIHINAGEVLNNNSDSINQVKTEVLQISFLQGRRVGLVNAYGTALSSNDSDTQKAQNISDKILNILRELSRNSAIFPMQLSAE